MSTYNDALCKFVLRADPQTVAEIKQLWTAQQLQEQKCWTARQQLEKVGGDLTAFDQRVYEDMTKLSARAHSTLRKLGIPLFDKPSDPRATQQLLVVLGDLAAAREI